MLEIETLFKIKLNVEAMFLFIAAFVVYDRVRVYFIFSLIIFYSKHN